MQEASNQTSNQASITKHKQAQPASTSNAKQSKAKQSKEKQSKSAKQISKAK